MLKLDLHWCYWFFWWFVLLVVVFVIFHDLVACIVQSFIMSYIRWPFVRWIEFLWGEAELTYFLQSFIYLFQLILHFQSNARGLA